MKYRQLGTSGIQISAVIFGGWQTTWPGAKDEETIAAHRTALEKGITAFDTAAAYGGGYSERILATALGDRRDEIAIFTKVFPGSLEADKLKAACEQSLKALSTDRIDLYQIHWPAGSFGSDPVPIEETMGAMNDLKKEGKIRAIGVSNFNRQQIEEANQYGEIVSLQPPYSLFWRQVERDAGPYCIEKGISIIAYSPLAQGLLTGRFGPGHQFPKDDSRNGNRLFKGELNAAAQAALEQLRPFAKKYNTTLGNLSLAWLLAQPQTNVIVGARKPEQAAENALAADIEISPEDLKEMGEIGRTVSDKAGDDANMWSSD